MENGMNSSAGDSGNGGNFLRSRLKLALNSSNDILSGLSNNISRLSIFSTSSSFNADTTSGKTGEDSALPLHKLPGASDPKRSPPSSRRSPTTMKERIKGTLKDNLRELEDLMASDSSSEPSTLPTNTPDSPKGGFRFNLSSINQSLPKKFGDYKALAIRTLSGEGAEPAEKEIKTCAIRVECVDDPQTEPKNGKKGTSQELDNASTCLSSPSYPSIHSLRATGPDPFDKIRYKHDVISSGTPSEGDGFGHSTSMDSTDSDPHKKLWFRSSSQGSLQSWASSLSYDSQAEEPNEIREFMMTYVEDVFKQPHTIDVDRKAEFGKLAQNELGRLWFARCINAKRCCKCVAEASFFSLIQHFSVMLFECAEADDFSPAKSLMNMCFTYYHEATTPSGGQNRFKEFLYTYLRQQPIWRTLRFWNAAFFDALQCERTLRPIVTREEIEVNRLQAVTDELHYQENITFGQLGTFTCNMHAFGLSKEMIIEFLRKQVTIASLRPDQVKLLRENIDRMFSSKKEWH